jgi:hypothetical protein
MDLLLHTAQANELVELLERVDVRLSGLLAPLLRDSRLLLRLGGRLGLRLTPPLRLFLLGPLLGLLLGRRWRWGGRHVWLRLRLAVEDHQRHHGDHLRRKNAQEPLQSTGLRAPFETVGVRALKADVHGAVDTLPDAQISAVTLSSDLSR